MAEQRSSRRRPRQNCVLKSIFAFASVVGAGAFAPSVPIIRRSISSHMNSCNGRTRICTGPQPLRSTLEELEEMLNSIVPDMEDSPDEDYEEPKKRRGRPRNKVAGEDEFEEGVVKKVKRRKNAEGTVGPLFTEDEMPTPGLRAYVYVYHAGRFNDFEMVGKLEKLLEEKFGDKIETRIYHHQEEESRMCEIWMEGNDQKLLHTRQNPPMMGDLSDEALENIINTIEYEIDEPADRRYGPF